MTALILVVTAWVIYKYTNHTYELLKGARRQNELQIRPLVVIGTEDDEFFVKNIGKSTALNISVEELNVIVNDDLIVNSGSDRTFK